MKKNTLINTISVKEVVDLIIADGVITPSENKFFVELIEADGVIDKEEGLQVVRLYDLIKSGNVKVINE